MSALTRLAEKVESGEGHFVILAAATEWDSDNGNGLGECVVEAYHGSLTTAKALHDAVLPGWWFAIKPNCATVGNMDYQHDGKIFDGKSTSTARAWLLAILRALAAGETP
jgi:hypothetical protein